MKPCETDTRWLETESLLLCTLCAELRSHRCTNDCICDKSATVIVSTLFEHSFWWGERFKTFFMSTKVLFLSESGCKFVKIHLSERFSFVQMCVRSGHINNLWRTVINVYFPSHVRCSTLHFSSLQAYFDTVPCDQSCTHPHSLYFHDQSQRALVNGTAHSSWICPLGTLWST